MNGGKVKEVTSGAFRLKSRYFHKDKLRINRHQLSQKEGVSYPTLLRYLGQPEDEEADPIVNFSGEVLYALLVEGFGMSPIEVENLRVGDIFEVVPKNGNGAAK